MRETENLFHHTRSFLHGTERAKLCFELSAQPSKFRRVQVYDSVPLMQVIKIMNCFTQTKKCSIESRFKTFKRPRRRNCGKPSLAGRHPNIAFAVSRHHYAGDQASQESRTL